MTNTTDTTLNARFSNEELLDLAVKSGILQPEYLAAGPRAEKALAYARLLLTVAGTLHPASAPAPRNVLKCATCGADRSKEACRSQKPTACPFTGRANATDPALPSSLIGNGDVAYMERMAKGTGPVAAPTAGTPSLYAGQSGGDAPSIYGQQTREVP